jgi:hypothetical protein
MEAPNTPSPTDAALLLPRATYYQVAHTLRGLLPPPITDTPEDAARRDIALIGHVASLLPANADEANLAAQYVAASAQALDCLRIARAHEDDDPKFALRHIAQSASMMRQARSWRLALLRAQAARETREASAAARDAATQTEHRALGLMADALAHAAPPPAPVPPADPRPDPIAEAERYALSHRKRAVLIRRFGRLPDKLAVGWLRPEVVHAIATGTTPTLRALDARPRHAPAAAA